MTKTLKIGSKVVYRGAWGTKLPKETTIESIEYCADGGKYGDSVEECNKSNYMDCVFDLADGHWCYGHQIDWAQSINLN